MPLPEVPTLLPINVQFGGPTITITYADPRQQGARVNDTITRDIDVALIADEVDDLVSTISEIIERTDVIRRGPPETIEHER